MLEAETREGETGAVALPLPAKLRPRQPAIRFRPTTTMDGAGWLDPAATRRLFVLLPFAAIAGLIAYAALPVEPLPEALAGVGAALALLVILLRRSAGLPLAALAAAAWIGFCLLTLHALWFGTSMLTRPAYGLYEARVGEIVSATAESRRIVVSGLVPVEGDRAVDIARARLVVPPEPLLAPGDVIRARLRLAPVPGPILPGAFDGQFHAYFSGIGAYGNVTGDLALVATGDSLDPTRAIEGLRMAIGGRIDAVLDGPSAAIGRAMVVGDQSAIDDETREIMAASGLAHIYSISGLHLSIVAGGVFFLLRLLLASIPAATSRWPVKKIAAIGGIVAAAGYLLLAGGLGNVPALRSTIMLALIFGAVLAGRRALTMRNVAIAALAIIVIDPASVFRASFQLSFAAVVALIGIYEMPRSPRTGERNWGERLWATVWTTALTSFIAGTATLLFSAYHFQQTAPLGVVGNVLVLPVVSIVIMPFAVLSVLAMPLGAEAPFVGIMGWGIDRMVDGATLVARWSEGLTGNPLLTSTALMIGLAALAWFAFVNSWWRLLGPAVAVPLVLLVGLDQRPDILIADTTQAVALRTETGMGLISGRAGSFATDVWSEHYQEPIAETVDGLRCDSLGCIARTDRFSVAVIRNPAAFAEDCGLHALVIARVRAPATCIGSQVIDADALAAGGVHWLAWNEAAARFDIRTAIPNLTRPWRVVPP
ncbi:ComEC/Rec2 family competence protein [Devosia sp.]|uniref:ComEC/Rec2 family competence protein n=1 Tax=Devosia sp. TaxID=1871048 RepID=UPI001A04EEE3|nr:ComEC/Rec2 family competence protein [Devosia sp.]MBE0579257.1 ComEC/Rec2 family competence protein [Devosia sp.]